MRRYSRRGKNNQPSGQGWMTTYADLMTLILVFFVLLYSFSSLDTAKFQTVIYYIQEALGLLEAGATLNLEVEPTALPGENTAEWELEQLQLEDLQGQLETFIREKDLADHVLVNIEERGLVVRFFDSVLFELGSAELKDESKELLEMIVTVIKDIPNQIRAEGHTDDLPINTYRYPSNWELSGSRACSVIQYFIETGFSPYQLSFAGYGEFRPIAPNQINGQPLNRRVDLVVLRTEWKNIEPTGLYPGGEAGF